MSYAYDHSYKHTQNNRRRQKLGPTERLIQTNNISYFCYTWIWRKNSLIDEFSMRCIFGSFLLFWYHPVH